MEGSLFCIATRGYRYSDYGEVASFEGTPLENEVCYTGAVYDGTTGEHYLRARYYDPETAVFTTQDTLKGGVMDESLWNSYAYCNGDPVNHIDPSGHYSVKKAVQYAHKWSEEDEYIRNPEYDDYGKHADCTNFVSQCVHAGGIKMTMPQSHPINKIHSTVKYWYAKMPPQRPHYIYSTSTSWIRVSDFYRYFKGVGGAHTIPKSSKKGYLGQNYRTNAIREI